MSVYRILVWSICLFFFRYRIEVYYNTLDSHSISITIDTSILQNIVYTRGTLFILFGSTYLSNSKQQTLHMYVLPRSFDITSCDVAALFLWQMSAQREGRKSPELGAVVYLLEKVLKICCEDRSKDHSEDSSVRGLPHFRSM